MREFLYTHDILELYAVCSKKIEPLFLEKKRLITVKRIVLPTETICFCIIRNYLNFCYLILFIKQYII